MILYIFGILMFLKSISSRIDFIVLWISSISSWAVIRDSKLGSKSNIAFIAFIDSSGNELFWILFFKIWSITSLWDLSPYFYLQIIIRLLIKIFINKNQINYQKIT